jgi:Holin of 3TMs, for gene-transfer release
MIPLLDSLLELGKVAIDKIWPDPIKRAEEYRKLEELHQTGELAQLNAEVTLLSKQMDINMTEASHSTIFVAGWRPFVGWVGGFAFAYSTIIEPIMRFTAKMAGYVGDFPEINNEITLQILLGMLGLGLMRSYEKKNAIQTNGINKPD